MLTRLLKGILLLPLSIAVLVLIIIGLIDLDLRAMSTYEGYSAVLFYKQAIEKTGSLDPDEVKKVLDDPNWTYEWFGAPGRSLGGLETFGIRRVNQDERRVNQDETCLSVVRNGKKVPISCKQSVVP